MFIMIIEKCFLWDQRFWYVCVLDFSKRQDLHMIYFLLVQIFFRNLLGQNSFPRTMSSKIVQVRKKPSTRKKLLPEKKMAPEKKCYQKKNGTRKSKSCVNPWCPGKSPNTNVPKSLALWTPLSNAQAKRDYPTSRLV